MVILSPKARQRLRKIKKWPPTQVFLDVAEHVLSWAFYVGAYVIGRALADLTIHDSAAKPVLQFADDVVLVALSLLLARNLLVSAWNRRVRLEKKIDVSSIAFSLAA